MSSLVLAGTVLFGNMGQEHSLIDHDTPTETLRERSLEAVAEYIKSGKVRRIVVMSGAGISTAAGSKFSALKLHIYIHIAHT